MNDTGVTDEAKILPDVSSCFGVTVSHQPTKKRAQRASAPASADLAEYSLDPKGQFKSPRQNLNGRNRLVQFCRGGVNMP